MKPILKMDTLDLTSAILFATKRHGKQTRKITGVPYIVHPIEVMDNLCGFNDITIECLMAAVLHDVLEDTPTTFEELEFRFGKQIADIVQSVSDDKKLSKVERKKKQVSNASYWCFEAACIKISDKISNCSDLQEHPMISPEYTQGYFTWSLAIIRAIIRRFGETHSHIMRHLYETFMGITEAPFYWGGVAYPCLSPDMTIEKYYALCSEST